jgi:hypothetical protein
MQDADFNQPPFGQKSDGNSRGKPSPIAGPLSANCAHWCRLWRTATNANVLCTQTLALLEIRCSLRLSYAPSSYAPFSDPFSHNQLGRTVGPAVEMVTSPICHFLSNYARTQPQRNRLGFQLMFLRLADFERASCFLF